MAEKIFLDYDQAGLDEQYKGAGRIPNYESYIPRWETESAAARTGLRMIADVAYGDHAAETYDVFPAGDGAPVHVFVHGGFWLAQDKHVFEFMAPAFVAAGATFVSINYPLCPEVSLTRLTDSCRAALAHVWRNAGDWGADANRLHLAGHSAGGHITAMLMSTDWPGRESGLPRDMIKGGLAISGLYELESIRLCYVNDDLNLSDEEVVALSPLRQLPERSGELLLAFGGDESDEFSRHQTEYAAAWSAKALPGRTIDMPGLNHFSIMDDYAAPNGKLFKACTAQMGL